MQIFARVGKLYLQCDYFDFWDVTKHRARVSRATTSVMMTLIMSYDDGFGKRRQIWLPLPILSGLYKYLNALNMQARAGCDYNLQTVFKVYQIGRSINVDHNINCFILYLVHINL